MMGMAGCFAINRNNLTVRLFANPIDPFDKVSLKSLHIQPPYIQARLSSLGMPFSYDK